MAYLYCKKHGKEKIESIISESNRKKKSKEYTKVTCGLLLKDFICDECNQELPTNDIAYLVQYFPSLGYESPDDFTAYFNDPIFVAYWPERDYALAEESMDGDYTSMNEIKNISPEEIIKLYKKIWQIKD
jgi:hypothetical protein